MAQSAKKKTLSDEEFVLMGRTRALLSQAWGLWSEELKNSPEIVKRMLEQGVKELHRAETQLLAQSKGVVQKKANKLDRKVAKKVSSVTKKVNSKVKAVTKKVSSKKHR